MSSFVVNQFVTMQFSAGEWNRNALILVFISPDCFLHEYVAFLRTNINCFLNLDILKRVFKSAKLRLLLKILS